MSVYKRGKIYWYKFSWRNELIRESTKQTNKRVAEQMEAARKTQLAKGEVGIRDRAPVPTLAVFAEERFLSSVRIEKVDKPNTIRFYETCVENLIADKKLSNSLLDAITPEIIAAFIERRRSRGRKTSTINRDLATLRRILNIAVELDVISARRKIRLLPGEAQRERVLSVDEEDAYLASADPLLRAVSTIILDCGMRPEECHRLRWELNIRDCGFDIHTGKGKGSRRRIPATPRVLALLEMLRPQISEGWVFPAATKSGHIEQSSYKKQHAAALRASKVPQFVIYSLRHTCLTRWAKTMDPFTLQKLAGHRSLATTMRYVHLNDEDVSRKLKAVREQAEQARAGHKSRHRNPLDDSQGTLHEGDVAATKEDSGATRRDRTGDLLITNQPLYQLS